MVAVMPGGALRSVCERTRLWWQLHRLAGRLRSDDAQLADLLTEHHTERQTRYRIAQTYVWWMLLALSALFLFGGLLLDVPAADAVGLGAAAACYSMHRHRAGRVFVGMGTAQDDGRSGEGSLPGPP